MIAVMNLNIYRECLYFSAAVFLFLIIHTKIFNINRIDDIYSHVHAYEVLDIRRFYLYKFIYHICID
jgi:hypothetical protein